MKVYTAQEAADTIGINSRTLRRHLRLSESWKAAGFGGRYQFTDTDVRALKRELSGVATRSARSTRKRATPSVLPEVIPAVLTPDQLGKKLTRAERSAIEDRYDARQARLLARLDEVLVTA